MSNVVRLTPPREGEQDQSKWIGRVVIFELVTGSRIQGKIIGMNPKWIDTDNGAVQVRHIVSAKWVTPEEESIIRGGPIQPWDPNRQLR